MKAISLNYFGATVGIAPYDEYENQHYIEL